MSPLWTAKSILRLLYWKKARSSYNQRLASLFIILLPFTVPVNCHYLPTSSVTCITMEFYKLRLLILDGTIRLIFQVNRGLIFPCLFRFSSTENKRWGMNLKTPSSSDRLTCSETKIGFWDTFVRRVSSNFHFFALSSHIMMTKQSSLEIFQILTRRFGILRNIARCGLNINTWPCWLSLPDVTHWTCFRYPFTAMIRCFYRISYNSHNMRCITLCRVHIYWCWIEQSGDVFHSLAWMIQLMLLAVENVFDGVGLAVDFVVH